MSKDVVTDVAGNKPSGFSREETRHWTPSRRDFLRMLGAGAAVAAAGPLSAFANNGSAGAGALRSRLLQDDRFWASINSMFVLDPSRTFMNIGTAGSMPKISLDVFDEENRTKARTSGSGYTNLLAERTRVAPGFGVDPDELAFSANTSSGMCHAILGLDWKAGDVVVTTNHEHPGGDVPLQIAVDRYGIQVSRVALPVGNDQTAATYVNLFEQRIRELRAAGKRVRAMMWSSPTYKTGTMLPIAELVDVAKRNELISIVDGAHLPGMMAYDYASLGMDFMSGAGHKWQCGPGSTGILVVRNKIRGSNPLPLPKWYPIHTSSYPTTPLVRTTTGTASFDIGSIITSCGSLHTPMFSALVKACELWDQIGRKKIETYDLTLSQYLKEKIAERWGVERLYSPKDDPKLLSAITSFNPFHNTADVLNSTKSGTFVSRLLSDYNRGFVIRNVNVPVINSPADHWPVRISTHLWHNASDIDRLVDAMWDLSKKLG
jgi:selenocysteine lyase/cysteine desulfurase